MRDGAMACVCLEDAGVNIEGKQVLNHLDLSLAPGQTLALMGPSGIGKSTLLKVLAGLRQLSSGAVSLPEKVSMVFDSDALYPFLSAQKNIELGSPFNQTEKAAREENARHWADVFHCSAFMTQKACTLSNGQRKRVGLARAMMKRPQLLLLDETFHAMDEELKTELMDTVKNLQEKEGFALVFATHNRLEAEAMGAQILTLD